MIVVAFQCGGDDIVALFFAGTNNNKKNDSVMFSPTTKETGPHDDGR